MTTQSEYIALMMKTAGELWGSEEAERIRKQIETTAAAVWRNSQTALDIWTEPATRLRQREQR